MDRVLVAGIGNVLMGDDAIGPFCVRQLHARFLFPPHVNLVDLGAPGLDLVLHVADAEVVIFVDSLKSYPAGQVHSFSRHEMMSSRCDARMDTHAPALEEAITIAELSGHGPHDVRLVGLAGESFELGQPLSERVRAGMPQLQAAVLGELVGMGIAAVPRALPQDPCIWWESPSTV